MPVVPGGLGGGGEQLAAGLEHPFCLFVVDDHDNPLGAGDAPFPR